MGDAIITLEKIDTLIAAGKERALKMLEEASVAAKTQEEVSNQTFVVQVAACHTLALCALYHEQHGELRGEEWLDGTLVQIKRDFQQLLNKTKKDA